MSKRKVLKLELDEDYDFLIFGLVSTTKDYRICYQINKLLDIDLAKEKDIELKISKTGNTDQFSFYEYINEDQVAYYFICNKGKSGSFIPEYKQLDYFLIVKNFISDTSEGDIIKKLKATPLILGVFPINASKLKSRNNLLF